METALPEGVTSHVDYLKSFFSRGGPDAAGVYDTYYGCGNSMMDLDQIKFDGELFEASSNETGGEQAKDVSSTKKLPSPKSIAYRKEGGSIN